MLFVLKEGACFEIVFLRVGGKGEMLGFLSGLLYCLL